MCTTYGDQPESDDDFSDENENEGENEEAPPLPREPPAPIPRRSPYTSEVLFAGFTAFFYPITSFIALLRFFVFV